MSTVLVVDDSSFEVMLLASYLQSIPNLRVITFTSAAEAFEWCRKKTPDLVFVDYFMPEIDGLAFVRSARAIESMHGVPITMITSDETRETRYQALCAGANDFLTKPVDRTEFVARTRNMLGQRTRERELKEQNERLIIEATTDHLTRLRNRRYFVSLLERAIADPSPNRDTLCLLLIDVDHFKKINDTYGHDAGDAVLQAVAGVLREISDNDHLPARIGGEEFAMVLDRTPLRVATEIAERIRHRVADLNFEVANERFKTRLSIGVTKMKEGGDTLRSMLKRADLALYRAKANGRDRVEVAHETEFDLDLETAPATDERRSFRCRA